MTSQNATENPLVIHRPAGVSGGPCLFVVVLSVLSLSLSRLSPWRRFLSTLSMPRSTPAWFLHFAVISLVVVSVIFVVFAVSLLRRFLYPIPDPLVFVPNTFYTHYVSMYGLFQNPGLNKNHVFTSKPSFTQSDVLHKNRAIHKHHVLQKNMFSLGLCKCCLRLAG